MTKRRTFTWMAALILMLAVAWGGEAFAAKRYTVRQGDTLAAIARKTGVSLPSLKKANRLSSAKLKIGQALTIPAKGKHAVRAAKTSTAKAHRAGRGTVRYHTVRRGETLAVIAKRYETSPRTLARLNHLRGRTLRAGRRLKLPAAAVAPAPAGEDALAAAEREEEAALLEEPCLDETVDATGMVVTNTCLLGTWSGPEERRLFVRVVRGFLGAPYRLGGSTVRGLDCAGFVQKVYEFFDIALPRTCPQQSQLGLSVARDMLEEGDLVFFRGAASCLNHVGIYIGNNEFVHASVSERTVRIDKLDSAYYSAHFAKAVRLKGWESAL